jgi:hypothetical protein
MPIPGKRLKRTRLIQGGRYVVAVEVEMVIPPDDPSEPCYEAETVQFLHEAADRASQGDRRWMQAHGTVYELVESS